MKELPALLHVCDDAGRFQVYQPSRSLELRCTSATSVLFSMNIANLSLPITEAPSALLHVASERWCRYISSLPIMKDPLVLLHICSYVGGLFLKVTKLKAQPPLGLCSTSTVPMFVEPIIKGIFPCCTSVSALFIPNYTNWERPRPLLHI